LPEQYVMFPKITIYFFKSHSMHKQKTLHAKVVMTLKKFPGKKKNKNE